MTPVKFVVQVLVSTVKVSTAADVRHGLRWHILAYSSSAGDHARLLGASRTHIHHWHWHIHHTAPSRNNVPATRGTDGKVLLCRPVFELNFVTNSVHASSAFMANTPPSLCHHTFSTCSNERVDHVSSTSCLTVRYADGDNIQSPVVSPSTSKVP